MGVTINEENQEIHAKFVLYFGIFTWYYSSMKSFDAVRNCCCLPLESLHRASRLPDEISSTAEKKLQKQPTSEKPASFRPEYRPLVEVHLLDLRHSKCLEIKLHIYIVCTSQIVLPLLDWSSLL